jgi:hypothetical protein
MNRKTSFSIDEALALNNICPGAQNADIGAAIRTALMWMNRNPWYVNSTTGNDNYDGMSKDKPFLTITQAVSKASAGDIIYLRGEFNEGAAVTINKELIIVGENASRNGYPTLVLNSADHQLFIVKANNVQIRNIGFVQTEANIAIQIGDTAGQAYYKLFIENCKFDLYGTGTYAIASGDTADAPDVHINNCLFRSFATAAILSNWTRARISNNTFIVPTGVTGIVHSPATTSRPDTQIVDNDFITADNSGAIGITVTNTPGVGLLFIKGNQFVYFADDDACISKRTGYTGLNYLGITAIAITT